MIICEDIFAIFIYTDIAMMLKLQYSFNKWDSSNLNSHLSVANFVAKHSISSFIILYFSLAVSLHLLFDCSISLLSLSSATKKGLCLRLSLSIHSDQNTSIFGCAGIKILSYCPSQFILWLFLFSLIKSQM